MTSPSTGRGWSRSPAPRPARGARAALAVVLALVAATASAETRPASRTAASKQPAKAPASLETPAPSPASVPLPPPPAGTSLHERSAPSAWSMSAALGPMLALSDAAATGLGLRIDLWRPFRQLSPTVSLDFALPVTFAHWGDTQTVTVAYGTTYPFAPQTQTTERTSWWFAAVPSARFWFDVVPKLPRLRLYADGGLGITAAAGTVTTDQQFQGRNVASANSIGAVVRLAGGATFGLSDQVRLLFEPVGLDFHIGSGASTWSLLFGAAWRL